VEIEFFGGNCFRLKTKQTTVVVDDNLQALGKKSIQTEKTAAFYTALTVKDEAAAKTSRLVIDSAGEFEVGDLTVKGVQARAHMDTDEERSATVFQFMFAGQTVTVLGHIHPDVSDEVIELVSGTDVLIVPVGGNGYTLDPIGATTLIKKFEPDVVIPSQYDIAGFNYEIPAQPLEEFMKVSSLNAAEPQDSYKLAKADDAGTQTRVVLLNVK
jgi:L-ascorbate metabolism protein UlaG (beta-lactamase superfamily)